MMTPLTYMTLSACSFAAMGTAVKFLGQLPFWQLVLFRSVMVMALCLPGILPLGRQIFGKPGNRTLLFLRGLFGTAGLTIFYRTLHGLDFGTAVTIQYTSPVFTAAIVTLILRKEPPGLHLIWGLLAFAGIFVICGFKTGGIDLTLAGLGLLGAFFSGWAYNCIGLLKQREHPQVIMFYLPLVTIPLVLLPSLRDYVAPAGSDYLWLPVMGVSTYFGQYFLTRAYQTGPVSGVAVYGNLNVVMALLSGILFFSEIPEAASLAGTLLVLLSVFFVQKSSPGKSSRPLSQSQASR